MHFLLTGIVFYTLFLFSCIMVGIYWYFSELFGGVFPMGSKETPKENRERIRQNELKNNPTGSLHEGLKRTENGNLVDLAGGIGWKGFSIIILVLILGMIIYIEARKLTN